jgi:hypothetical protein
MKRFLQALLFAAIACGVVFLVEIFVLWAASAFSGRQYMPRGIGWAALPIMAAIGGWRIGWEFSFAAFFSSIRDWRDGLSFAYKAWAGYSGLWMVSCSSFFFVFDPFGRYRWGDAEYSKFLFILIAPIVIAFLAIKIFQWAKRGR